MLGGRPASLNQQAPAVDNLDVSGDDPRLDLQQAVLLWSASWLDSEDLVAAALRALAAGVDSPTLPMLAGLERYEARESVRELLPTVLKELGIALPPADTFDSDLMVAQVFAHRILAGAITPRQGATMIYGLFGGFGCPDEVYPFLLLSDEYDIVGTYTTRTVGEIDAAVREAARELLEHGRCEGTSKEM
jgi:hypothetical protein